MYQYIRSLLYYCVAYIFWHKMPTADSGVSPYNEINTPNLSDPYHPD